MRAHRTSKLNRTEFIIATAIILFAAFCMGWFANWLAHRLSRVRQSDVADLDRDNDGLPCETLPGGPS